MSSNSLDEYRILVAAATYDELDKHDLERRTSTKDLQCSAASSVVSSVDASTVDIDNTHPYLIRYAEIYAEENNTDTSTAPQAGPTFVNIKSTSNKYNEGDKVVKVILDLIFVVLFLGIFSIEGIGQKKIVVITYFRFSGVTILR